MITVPFGIHAEFNNLQVFDKKKIKKIINKFKPRKFDLKYVTYSKGTWRECSIEECLINQKKFKKNSFDLKSSQSVAFIKLVK